MLTHLRNGGWCSLVPDSFGALLPEGDEISLIPLTDAPEPVQIGGLLLRREPQSPMVRAFDETLTALTSVMA